MGMVDVRPETDEMPQVVEDNTPTPVAPPVTRSDMYVYNQDTPRVYLNRSLEVNKGDVVEWPNGAPDVCWDAVTDSKDA